MDINLQEVNLIRAKLFTVEARYQSVSKPGGHSLLKMVRGHSRFIFHIFITFYGSLETKVPHLEASIFS